MEIRQANFAAFFDVLTANTYVMVIMSDSSVGMCYKGKFFYYYRIFSNIFKLYSESAATQMNINVARKHFEKLEVTHMPR